jgi:NADH dehydrogenase
MEQRLVKRETTQVAEQTSLPRIVIVGGGFGGLNAAQALSKAPVRITMIDRRNYHLFQPLLYQVATAELSSTDIASPIRQILHSHKNIEMLLAEVTAVDTERQEVHIKDMRMQELHSIAYDYLILATGSQQNYFGHDEWKKLAPGLKSIEDALEIRRRILSAFESAELETDPEERKALLTFVLVGGGATGVELAGALAELARVSLVRDFRRIDTKDTRIILVEGEPNILSSFPKKLSLKAQAELNKLGVEVRTSNRVTAVEEGAAMIGDERLATKNVIWTAGVLASDAGKWLGGETDHSGCVLVNPDLSVPGHPNIFVIGDTSRIKADKQGLPGVAQVAIQEGHYVASVITHRIEGKAVPAPFKYFDKGNLATVGRSFGVADIGPVKTTGFLAWVLWLVVHILFLIGFRNRALVVFQWAWAYFTFQRGSRIITSNYTPEVTQDS